MLLSPAALCQRRCQLRPASPSSRRCSPTSARARPPVQAAASATPGPGLPPVVRHRCLYCRQWKHSQTCLSLAATGCAHAQVNWHLEPRCNYACKFCFATFEDVQAELLRSGGSSGARSCGESASGASPAAPTPQQLLAVPRLLAQAGCSRLSFVGRCALHV